LESGLGWIVKHDKGELIGRAAIDQQKAAGVPKKLVGFELDEPGIARFGDGVATITDVQSTIGTVTSGTKTPTVNKALGMAIVDAAFTEPGSRISLVVRGRPIAGHLVSLPFYKRK
jgi:aminomethyltransferase